jgi:hypothetical protein
MDMVTYYVCTLKPLCEANSRALLRLVQLRPSLPFLRSDLRPALPELVLVYGIGEARLECWCLAH